MRFGAASAAKQLLAGLALGLGALCAAVLAQAACAASPLDDTVVVRGNHRIEAAVVRGYFHTKPDGGLDAAAVNDGLKALYASGLFADANVAWSGTHLVVTVTEAAVIDRVQFEGNRQFKDKELTSKIRSKAKTPLTKAGVQDDVECIAELYRHNGRYDATITPKTIAKGEGRVDLVFEIKEGPKTGIAKIVFIGNHAFSDQRLKGVIKTSESGWLAFLKTTDVYDADRLESDRDLLHAFYLKHGYADAQVVAATGAYDATRKGFEIAFTIDEGDRYRFGAIDITSNIGAVDVAALREALTMSSGDVYDASAVDKSVDALALAVSRHGFPFATVHAKAQRDRKQKLLDLVLALDDGPHTYIERIAVRGNTFTQDQVIRREFDIHEGDAYNKSLVVRAERRLKALNLFKSVKTSTEPGSSPDRVVLDVDIEEEQTGEFYRLRRLFDELRHARRSDGGRAQLHGSRPIREGVGQPRTICALGQAEPRPALFPRHSLHARPRPVRQPDADEPQSVLCQHELRLRDPDRRTGHRHRERGGALFDRQPEFVARSGAADLRARGPAARPPRRR